MSERQGWVVSRVRCRACGYEAVCVYEDGTPEDRLECARCHAQDSLTHRVPRCDRTAVWRLSQEQTA